MKKKHNCETIPSPCLPPRIQEPILVTLPDGKTVDGVAWETTPLDIANSISPVTPQSYMAPSQLRAVLPLNVLMCDQSTRKEIFALLAADVQEHHMTLPRRPLVSHARRPCVLHSGEPASTRTHHLRRR